MKDLASIVGPQPDGPRNKRRAFIFAAAVLVAVAIFKPEWFAQLLGFSIAVGLAIGLFFSLLRGLK